MYASFRLDYAVLSWFLLKAACRSVDLQCLVNLRERLEVRSEEVDVMPNIGRTRGFSDRVH